MPSAPPSVRPDRDPIAGESIFFGDVELIAAPIEGCNECAFDNHQSVGGHTCGYVRCHRIQWITPIQYITLRLTK